MKPQHRGCLHTALLLLLLVGCNGTISLHGLLTNPVQPDPNPPVVVTVPQFRLLIVEETADRPSLPASQLSIFTSTKLRAYLNEHCAKLGDGSSGYRIVDKDDVANLPVEFRNVPDAKNTAPWLYATNGNKGVSCPLPTSVDALIEKIRPYAEGGK